MCGRGEAPGAASAFEARAGKEVPAWKAKKAPPKEREGTQSFRGVKQVAPERVMKNAKPGCIARASGTPVFRGF